MLDDTASDPTLSEHIGQVSSDSTILYKKSRDKYIHVYLIVYTLFYLKNSLLMAGKSHWGHTAKSSSTICRPCKDKVTIEIWENSVLFFFFSNLKMSVRKLPSRYRKVWYSCIYHRLLQSRELCFCSTGTE